MIDLTVLSTDSTRSVIQSSAVITNRVEDTFRGRATQPGRQLATCEALFRLPIKAHTRTTDCFSFDDHASLGNWSKATGTRAVLPLAGRADRAAVPLMRSHALPASGAWFMREHLLVTVGTVGVSILDASCLGNSPLAFVTTSVSLALRHH